MGLSASKVLFFQRSGKPGRCGNFREFYTGYVNYSTI